MYEKTLLKELKALQVAILSAFATESKKLFFARPKAKYFYFQL
jgi:hypothetical protein